MIRSNPINRLVELLPAGARMVHQAKSGDVKAFVDLCDSYSEHVYRFVHFLAPNNRIAEAVTVQAFFKAWKHLNQYRLLNTSFVSWLYSIAREQLQEYTRLHKIKAAPDNIVALAKRGEEFREDFQTIRDAMGLLGADEGYALVLRFIVGLPNQEAARLMRKSGSEVRALQLNSLFALANRLGLMDATTVTKDLSGILENCLTEISIGASTAQECLTRHPRQARQLKPLLEIAGLLELGRDVKPPPGFALYTHDALIQNLRSRPRASQGFSLPALRRVALVFTVLLAALIVTGAVHAQSAMPGESFYGLKRASENVWLSFSSDKAAVNLVLAERRLSEWIAVMDDPARDAAAMNEYQAAISRLLDAADAGDRDLILTELQAQQELLNDAGLSSAVLDQHLLAMSANPPEDQVSPLEVAATATPVSTQPVTNQCPPVCAGDPNVNPSNAGNSDDDGGNNNPGGNNNGNGSNNNGGGNNGGGNNTGENNNGGGNNTGENNNGGGSNNGGGNNTGENNNGGGNNTGGGNDDDGNNKGGGKDK